MTKNKVPKVFLSSTVKGIDKNDPGLKLYREEIYKIITSKFGWECICFEENDTDFSGSNISACLNAVGKADLYIGIFWRRYGILTIPSLLPLTELEFYRALNLRKPIRIYVIRSDHREPSLKIFLDWLEREYFLSFCEINELKDKIKSYLEKFAKMWPSKSRLSSLVPPSYIDEIMIKLDLLPLELPIIEDVANPDIFDKELILEKLKNMRSYQSLYKYEEMIQEGWNIFNMLRFKPPHKYKEFRRLWIDFLILWEDACNWYGYIEGSMGSLWAAKSLMEIYRLSETWSLYNSSASVVSSNIYGLSILKQSKSQFISDSSLKNDLLNQSKQLLHQSLDFLNISFSRGGKSSVRDWSIRGNIYRQLGDFDKAINSHLMAKKRCKSDEAFGMQLSHLGRARLLKKDKEGLSNLEEAVSICNELKSPSAVRTLKALGQGLAKLREFDRAEETIKQALYLAEERKLGHQFESINATLDLIKKRKNK